MPRIRRLKSGALTITLDPAEGLFLRELPARLRQVLQHPDFQSRVFRRLFPPAYRDRAREAEYRELLGKDLLERKLEGIAAFEASLAGWKASRRKVEVTVEPEKFELWLGFLNDMRLFLGADLEIEEEPLQEAVDPTHPRARDMALFHYLGWLEEELLHAGGFEGFERLPEKEKP
jgi:hypothetical protein